MITIKIEYGYFMSNNEIPAININVLDNDKVIEKHTFPANLDRISLRQKTNLIESFEAAFNHILAIKDSVLAA